MSSALFLDPDNAELRVLCGTSEVFKVFDGILGRFYKRFIFDRFEIPTPPGLGAITLTFIVILIGWLGRQYAGRKIFDLWGKAVNYV